MSVKHARGLIGDAKIPLSVCLCVHMVPWELSHLVPGNGPGIGSRLPVTLIDVPQDERMCDK